MEARNTPENTGPGFIPSTSFPALSASLTPGTRRSTRPSAPRTPRRSEVPMRMIALGIAFFVYAAAGSARAQDAARWAQHAQSVTIIRDDWGIAHVYGKTDADAVFGMIYAQAEDDFNRVETNYLNAMGRLAEAEGQDKVYQDLRMKMFIDPEDLKKEYAVSPEWLCKLMEAFADGINFYLAKHPEVKPRVIQHFEPWMALSFTEGSIGGDIERVELKELQAFYEGGPGAAGVENHMPGEDDEAYVEPVGASGMADCAPNSAAPRAA